MEKKDIQLISQIKDEARSKSFVELASAAASDNESRLCAAFSACFKAAEEALGITPFDEQLLAALELVRGKIVQMQTGEGKTLSAVFAAYYQTLCGENVRIFTFNDYLARRDREWMKPVYDLLSVETACITAGTSFSERKAAYRAPVLYVSAKECCFDFLRDFTAQSEEETVSGDCRCAIVDEADSILIDEARIPLVVAGSFDSDVPQNLGEISVFAASLSEKCYEISLESKSVFLTVYGDMAAEKHFRIENIYDDENSGLLMEINACLKAHFLLEEDKDYIVRGGKILLVDAFTGRVAENRHYPGLLHAAVEIKHGLEPSKRGTVMGTIPLQFFMRRYPLLCGMTGTAMSAKDEFSELYDLQPEEIPSHLPSRRTDHEIQIYYDAFSKRKAICRIVKKANEKGQPVLLGTQSIEESEALKKMLEENGLKNVVILNAKNDETEADVIKNAGDFGRITVSTNMAGRGVDIKLGGAEEKTRGEVIAAGGLLVISTYLAESSRINNQLLGRAGRQGDVGESRRFVSLDEPLIKKYNLKSLIPEKHYPCPTADEIEDKVVLREVMRIQRISEGDSLEERKRLLKFTMIGEKHREAVFGTRRRILQGKPPQIWQTFPKLYQKAAEKYGEEKLAELERRTVTAKINEFWIDYLEYTDELREGIHLAAIGGKSPAGEYNIAAEKYYSGMEEALRSGMEQSLSELVEHGIESYKINVPGEISTYLIEENGDELKKAPYMGSMTEEETLRIMQEDDSYDENNSYDEDDSFDEDNSCDENIAVREQKPEKKKGGFFGLFRKK